MSRISDEFFDSLDERVLDVLDQPEDNVRGLLVEIEGDRIDMLALRAKNERLRAVVKFLGCGFACVHYPDQDRDHPGIQYPDCVDPDIECCVATALAALDEEATDE